MKQYFVLASKNLRRRGLRSWLTLLGILIGIATVISLISLGSGLKTAVNAQFPVSSTEVINVQAGGISGFGPPGSGAANPVTKDDVEAIERISSVEMAIPRYIQTARVEFNDRLRILSIISIPENQEEREFAYEEAQIKTSSGNLLEPSDTNKIMIGNDLSSAEKNGFEKRIKIDDKIIVEGSEFRVEGIAEKKGSFIVDGNIFMNEEDLVELKNLTEEVDIINVKVKNKGLVPKAKEEIEKVMRDRRDVKKGQEDFQVSTPESSLETVNNILSGIQAFIVIIASISIIVGTIGIANTMTTSVIERKREIGIMKAIGARNKNIFYQFLVEAGLLGMIGGIIGIILGVGIGYLGTNAINNFIGVTTKPEINIYLIVFALLGSFLIGAVSGIVPAMQAARQNPVEAIRE